MARSEAVMVSWTSITGYTPEKYEVYPSTAAYSKGIRPTRQAKTHEMKVLLQGMALCQRHISVSPDPASLSGRAIWGYSDHDRVVLVK